MKTSGWQGITTLALFALILCGILVGCRKISEEPMIIEPGVGVGRVKFGMPSKEVRKIFGKPDFEMSDSQMTKSLVYNELGLSIYIFKGLVKDIFQIRTSGYFQRKSI